MPEELHRQNIRCCEMCGSPVVVMGRSTKYYVPVNPVILSDIGRDIDAENFIRDRLGRAERIIVDLRKRIEAFEQGQNAG